MPLTTLRNGSIGGDVAALQHALNDAMPGVEALVCDGHFGNNTEKRVREYQKGKSLHVDGAVGTQTFNSLFATVRLTSTVGFSNTDGVKPATFEARRNFVGGALPNLSRYLPPVPLLRSSFLEAAAVKTQFDLWWNAGWPKYGALALPPPTLVGVTALPPMPFPSPFPTMRDYLSGRANTAANKNYAMPSEGQNIHVELKKEFEHNILGKPKAVEQVFEQTFILAKTTIGKLKLPVMVFENEDKSKSWKAKLKLEMQIFEVETFFFGDRLKLAASAAFAPSISSKAGLEAHLSAEGSATLFLDRAHRAGVSLSLAPEINFSSSLSDLWQGQSVLSSSTSTLTVPATLNLKVSF